MILIAKMCSASAPPPTSIVEVASRGLPRRDRGRSNPLNRNGEHISYTALGLDDARRAGVAFALAPQAKNLHVDAAIENILVYARGVQQVLPVPSENIIRKSLC